MDQWRLPRSTGNLAHDWLAATVAMRDAATDTQRAAVRVRVEALVARQAQHGARQRETLTSMFESMRPIVEQAAARLSRVLREIDQSWVDRARRTLPTRIGIGSIMDLDGRATAAAIARARARRGHGPPLRPLDPRRR